VRVPNLNWPKDLYADVPSRWVGNSTEGEFLRGLTSPPAGDEGPWTADLGYARQPDELVLA
jgi:hypothetical protein